MEDIFKDTIKKYGLIKKKDKIMLAVSGGPDSICMLHLFKKIQKDLRLDLLCVHFDHCLRDNSCKDADFVKELCKKLKIKLVTGKKDVKKFFKGDSLEQTARLQRFDFFSSCARKYKIKKIALAHNKDDVVETVLMRIIRGTALRGLRGILPKSRYQRLAIIRPLIEMEKKDILKWLENNKFDYRIDETNNEELFFRNKIRHSLIPFLTQFNPSIVNSVFNLARISAVDYDFITDTMNKEYQSIRKLRSSKVYLPIEKLSRMHHSLLLGVLRLAIKEIKGDLNRLELKHLDEVVDLLLNRKDDSIVHLPGIEVKKEHSSLIIKSLIL